MIIKKTFEIEVKFSFEDACLVVFEKMDSESCECFNLIEDKIIIAWQNRPVPVPLPDVWKQEVLDKIKEEISLEKIEEFYESNRR